MVCFCITNISSKGAAVEEMSIPDWLYAVKKYNLNYDGMKRVKMGVMVVLSSKVDLPSDRKKNLDS